jgi:hypothetical protein
MIVPLAACDGRVVRDMQVKLDRYPFANEVLNSELTTKRYAIGLVYFAIRRQRQNDFPGDARIAAPLCYLDGRP